MLRTLLVMLGISATTLLTPAAALEIIGHRGASHDAPENTVSSEKLGYAQGADGGECDIYLTRDHKIMVMHDEDTYRTAGISNKMAESTSTELRKLDIGKWGKWKGMGYSEKVPFLSELLGVIPDGKKLLIEIKCGPEILPFLQTELAATAKNPEKIVIIAFDYDVLKQAKAMMPQYKTLWLVGKERKTRSYAPVQTLIERAKAARFEGLDLISGFPIDKEFVSKVHSAGLKLYTWTVDEPDVAAKEAAAGVDGITTNRPEWLRQQLAGMQ